MDQLFFTLTSVFVFLFIGMFLISLLLLAKKYLVNSGSVFININGKEKVEVNSGSSLLQTLTDKKIFLPSACGGGGTCSMCKCQVMEGGGVILPTETPYFNRKEIKDNYRLACQVKVKESMEIKIPEEVFGIQKWECEVLENYNVASFIKQLVVKLPEDKRLKFKAGGYIQIDVPKIKIDFKDIDISEKEGGKDKFKDDWDKYSLWNLAMKNDEECFRAYSMASHPAEDNIIMLNVRIATPPWDGKNNNWLGVNPGKCSSYIFSLKPKDKVFISGPYGEFFIKDTGKEMLYIGGGAGMAPMRSHIFHLFHTLKTKRKVTFWYGGRSRKELFYVDEFREIEKQFPNFKFHLVLSEPLESDNWKEKKTLDDKGDGFVGFVHNAVIEHHLKSTKNQRI